MARDTRTGDLFAWVPPEIVPAVPELDIGAATLRGRLARMVALVLNECPLSREEIAASMAKFLGEEVSVHTLNQCASQAREDHTLSAIRCAALAHATGDLRVLQVLLAPLDFAAIPTRYLPAIEAEIKAERAEELARAAEDMRAQAHSARRQWMGARR